MQEKHDEIVEDKVEKEPVRAVVGKKKLFKRIQNLESLKNAPRSVKRKLLKEAKKARKKALR